MHTELTGKSIIFSAGYRLRNLLFIFSTLFLTTAILPSTASAGEISSSVCLMVSQLTGSTAIAIATFVVVAIGLMAMFGKVSWDIGFVVCAGIAIIFGAANIMSILGHGSSCVTNDPPFSFSCSGTGPSNNMFNANQKIFDEQNTPSGGVGGVFSRTLSYFKDTVGAVMSAMYCSFSNSVRVPLTIVMTLFIVVMGIMIATGMSNFTLKEAGVIMFKLALVWGFATNPEWGIGIGYKFFMGFSEEASNIVLSVIPSITGQAASLTAPDAVLSGFLGAFSGGPSNTGDPQAIISPNVPGICLIYMFIIFFLMLLFMPMAILFFVFLIIGYFGNLARALLNYLTALVLISFLFIFAPFFLTFALFRTTMPLFTDWIKHLTAYSLQMVIMFAFMAFLALIPFAQFLVSIVNLIRAYHPTILNNLPFGWKVTLPIEFCSFCEYHTPDESLIMSGTALTCLTPAESVPLIGDGHKLLGDGHHLPSVEGPNNNADVYAVIPFSNLLERTDLTIFIITNAIALWLICKVVNDFMKKVPGMAAEISQLPISAALGAGGTAGGINYLGMNAIRAGYMGLKNAMSRNYRHSFLAHEKERKEELRKKYRQQGMKDEDIEKRLKGRNIFGKALRVGGLGLRYAGFQLSDRTRDTFLRRPMHGVFGTQVEGKDHKHHRVDGFIQGMLHGATDRSLFGGLDTAAYENAVRRAQQKRTKAEERAKEADEQVRQRRETMESKLQEVERFKQEAQQELEKMAKDKEIKEEKLKERERELAEEEKRLQAEHAKKKAEFERAEYHAKEEHRRVLEAEKALKHEQKDSHLAREAGKEQAKGLLDITGVDVLASAGYDETAKEVKEALEARKAWKKSKDEEGLSDYKQSLENAISSLETMLANSPSLSPDEVARIQGMIRSAKSGLSTAGSVQSAGMISSEIDSISRYIQSAAMSSKK